MSAEQSAKAFDATPGRKLKAKRDGNVARSSELSAIAAFACATLATLASIPLVARNAGLAVVQIASHPDPVHPPFALVACFTAALLPAAAAACGAVTVNLAQSAGLHLSAPKLQLSRLNPVAGLKRMVGGEGAVGAARAIVAFLLSLFVLWPLCETLYAQAIALRDPRAFGALFLGGAQRMCWAAIAVGACFSVADYALARRRWLRELRMTLEEVRRDQKESDGDPHARSRRKALHRTLVRGSIAATKDASFVVVNPTHIAIAIRYAPPDVAVPQIVVRAADDVARNVRALAVAHGIPIIENVALARALYAQGEAGRPIPSPTFAAVARIIAELVRSGAIT